jgi:hypothetical protein
VTLAGDFERREMKMERKTILQQGKVTEVMSYLSNLPEHGKSPDALVSLSDIFSAKEYASEINGALKKGYSFDDLAKIFSEKCGVNISARQMKYHHTHTKNRAKKKQSTRKAPQIPATPQSVISE